jgi:hypothetical protein
VQEPSSLHQPSASEIDAIRLEETSCNGPCPVFTVELRRDGTADYLGSFHTLRIGRFRGTVAANAFHALAVLIVDTGFFGLLDSYSRSISCASSTTTSVRANGRVKSIYHYAYAGPYSLWQLEESIVMASDRIAWGEFSEPRKLRAWPDRDL